ncbi:DUF1349 domain-containing protein [Maribellus sp. CM-23]|uniref:DUF1349 domain-containing protein n=1 Tax=Maribellus sp. CM-23 TaxID=2781026 RepID=UPI001F444284|nr:DUF1349 domain-containing protein [Maribellus sp. CM-23]MCE4562787.1 DUF1349 domain-containing protein [Maribellus sp. CM-23]
MEKRTLENFEWINKPEKFVVDRNRVLIETRPETDLWQRTYYGFQNANAPAFLTSFAGDFSFEVKAEFEETAFRYDQCGVLLFIDNENWVKVSVEYENEIFARLGSVVTNLGFSDWATTDIPAGISEMWYRISRRGQDFYIENSVDGTGFRQMRMLHLHKASAEIKVGVYACSPLKSSFNAVFSEFKSGTCLWPEYETHE